MSDQMTEEQKKEAVGRCSYALLSLCTCAAFLCGLSANAYCDFLDREVDYEDDFDLQSACEDLGLTGSGSQMCTTLLEKHGVGFYGWYGTVPIDTQVCFPYTLLNPEVGYVTPDFDTTFNSARAFAIAANVFGSFPFFTLMISSCCYIDADRLKGLSFFLTMACFFQGMSLLLLKSDICEAGFFEQYFPNAPNGTFDSVVADVNCSLGRGSKLAITATVLYFLASGFAPTATPFPPIGYRGQEQQEEGDGAAAQAAGEGGEA